MISLFTTYLKPYWKQLILVLMLVLLQAMGNLFLPDLNAKIINEGVAKGDIATILQARRHHAAGLAGGRCDLDRLGVLGLEDRHGVRARRAQRHLPARRGVLADRGQLLRHAVAHHAQHQRRAAGAAARGHGAQHDDHGADHRDRRRHHGGAAWTCRSRPRWWSSSRSCWRVIGTLLVQGAAAVPGRCRSRSTASTRSRARRSRASA